MDVQHWYKARCFALGLPEATPSVPCRPKDVRKECVPQSRQGGLQTYRIPNVSVFAVGVMLNRGSLGDPAPSAKVSKALTPGFMTPLEARHQQLEIQKWLTRTQDNIRLLQQLLTSARTTEVEDELALALIDACLSLD